MEGRFWSKVEPTGFCWEWTAGKNNGGYGSFDPRLTGSSLAHRVSYELLVGPIPKGMVLDHLCRNRACVNPDHLEPVTVEENLRRGFGHGAESHCPHGHEYTVENTSLDNLGRRYCRECRRTRQRERNRALSARLTTCGECGKVYNLRTIRKHVDTIHGGLNHAV